MDQNSIDKLKMIVSSAIEFGKKDGITELSDNIKGKLVTMRDTLSLLHRLKEEQLTLQKKLATCVSSAAGLKEEIFTALNTPSEIMSGYHSLEESRDYYKAQLKGGIPDPERRDGLEKSLRMAEKGIEEFPKIEKLLKEGKAMSPLLDLAAFVYVLHFYAIACAEMSLSYPKQSLIGKLHILMLRYRLRSAIKETKDLYQESKLLWTLKTISKLLSVVPTKIDMLVSMIILKSKLRDCKIESTEDIQALIDLGPALDEILKEEKDSILILHNVVDMLESILKKGKSDYEL
jgi:hypothetical protein